MEFDHVFIATQHGAPEAQALINFGLVEGPPNQHLGQGTANRRFFFQNGFIELLYVTDETELHSETTRPAQLAERLGSQVKAKPSASPFGICFRPSNNSATRAPFPHRLYKPKYLPESLSVEVATSPINEPMWFHLSFTQPPKQELHPQNTPFKSIAGLCIEQPLYNGVSAVSETVLNTCSTAIQLKPAADHHLHIALNGSNFEEAKNTHSFHPDLPLTFYW